MSKPEVKYTKLFIDGQWVDAISGKTFATIDPSTEEVIAQIAEGDKADVEKAVAAARKAQPDWAARPASERAKLLYRVGRLLQEHARELAVLLRDFPCKINLIPFNTFAQSNYRRPSGNAVSRFWQVLVDAGFIVTVRTTRGDDIDAACGQLVGQVVDRTRRSERYRLSAGDEQVVRISG